MTVQFAPLIAAIPVVQSTTDRATQFPTPQVDQRVYNLATGAVELWSGTAWRPLSGLGGAGILDARAFGVVGDGTTDDTDAIQRALSAVPSGGARVLLPPTLCKVSASLHIETAGTVLCGHGPSSNLVSSVTGAETIIATGIDDVGMLDLQISGAHGGGINIQSSNNAVVARCRVSGATKAGGDSTQVGVKVQNVTGFRFVENYLFGNGDPTTEGGADFRANFGSTQIIDSIIAFNRCLSTGVIYNIALFDPRDCLVHGNRVGGAVVSPVTNIRLGYGIMLYESGGVTLANVCDNVVSENRIRSTQGTGIYATGCLRSIIVGNHLRDVCSLQSDSSLAAGGIVVEGANAKGSIVTGNKVFTCGKDSIQVSGADSVTVTGNNVDGSAQNGISLRGALAKANITGNTVMNTTARAIGSYSNAVQTNCTVANNTIDTLAVPGSSLGISTGALADGWNVEGNTLVGCNGRGMDLNGSNFTAHHNTEEGVPWFEGISGDRGDNSVTLTAYDKQTQRFATTLTANRTLTLPGASTLFKDARFRILREDAGAFTLTVKDAGGTTLKVMPSGGNSWVDVEWNTNNGGFWRETAAGAL